MMKKIVSILLFMALYSPIYCFEIYNTSIYPGVVNHLNTSYGYGTFHLNTMESDFKALTIKRTLTSNNSLTLYEYTYNNEGLLSGFEESFSLNGGDFRKSSSYAYEHTDGILTSVKQNGNEIYFPSGNRNNQFYFLTIKSDREELLFDFEYNRDNELSAITLNDVNGTRYFFQDNLLKSMESIGVLNNRLSAIYAYNENRELVRYHLEYSEGKGSSEKKTKYEFVYDENGHIEKYFFEKSGRGQDFDRVICGFEHLLNDNQTIDTSFALNDDGDTVRTARFEYTNTNNYMVKIYNDQDQLIVTYQVEQQ